MPGATPSTALAPATPPSAALPTDGSDGRDRAAAVHVRRVGKRFGSSWVVRDLDFTVERGTIFGLFGPSGAGKTTTIRLLLGLLDPDEGETRVLGTDPTFFDARTRARIGYLPQLFVLYPELSVGENLSLVASLYRMGWWRRRKRARQVLELVALWEHRRKTARKLSGGMQRRLELAAALVHDPELLVVDEPTAGIDPILRAKFWAHFRGLRDQGRTIVATSQYVTEAEHCDRVAVLAQGRVVACGTPADLRRQAMGGEIVDLATDGLTEPILQALSGLDGIRFVNRLSHEQLRLTVDQAGTAMPRAIAAITAHGVAVKQAREYFPSFEEVFVRLVGQADVAPDE